VSKARFFRGGAFRLSVIFSTGCIISGIVLFAAIYWQTSVFERKRISAFVLAETNAISQGSTNEILWTVRRRTAGVYPTEDQDMIFAALFNPDGTPIAGNLKHVPVGLVADGKVHSVSMASVAKHPINQPILAAARRLTDGRILVFGRGIRVLTSLENIVEHALVLGAIPAVGLVMAAGLWLSRQARWRIKVVNQSIERIMEGDVHERLPVEQIADDFDHLANGVNRMLAEIESLLAEVQGVGDNIAHDLRTPLARVRALLERGRDKAKTKEDLITVTDRAIVGLDQAQSIITALLRIGEIENGQRRSGFGDVDLIEMVQEAGELYGPMAEAKQIRFSVQSSPVPVVHGDRDLLIEAIANLLDNAIKFTPPGGAISFEVMGRAAGPVIRISDTGPGIPPEERAAVMRRFYRIDKSRHVHGSGLGLSIVLAIIKLHDFDVIVGDAQPGCFFELLCYTQPRPDIQPVRIRKLKRLVLPITQWMYRYGNEASLGERRDRPVSPGEAD
jgi:signal transduction histidine kinase